MRVLAIIRREYLERLRSKAFLIGTLLGPVLMAGLMVLPGVLMAKQRGNPLRVAVLDESGELRAIIEEALRSSTAEGRHRFDVRAPAQGAPETVRERLKAQVLDGSLDGYLYLPRGALESSLAEYHGRNVSNVMDLGLMDRAVEDALIGVRLRHAGVGDDHGRAVLRRLQLKTIRLSESGEREDRGASFFLSLILLMILYTTVAMWGAALMNGVIEEKVNRVVEVIVSSVSPTQLFAGKLLGIGAAGLTQFLAWAGFMLGLSLFGGAVAAANGLRLPDLPPLVLVLFVVFFLLGYFLYGAMYAAVGAAVNSHQEAQSLVFPVMMPLLVGVMLFPMVLASPDSALAVFCSFVPLWTPLLMFLRVTTQPPPIWQVLTSIALTAATVVLMNWAAARIYRVGILMYGKRPTLLEIVKWIGRE
ncbi:MAG TPA: ABC transporter permease [Vicinamibacteria bacterium]|nr:ABC transporter permease [Vicinamibacteria bacterium]